MERQVLLMNEESRTAPVQILLLAPLNLL